MLRAFLGLPPTDPGLRNPGWKNPSEQSLRSESSANGLVQPETVALPEGLNVDATELVTLASEIEQSVKQGQCTWAEVQSWFAQILAELRANFKADREVVISKFRQGLGRVSDEIRQIKNLLPKRFFGRWHKKISSGLINLLLVGALSFSQVKPAVAQNGDTLAFSHRPAVTSVENGTNIREVNSWLVDPRKTEARDFRDSLQLEGEFNLESVIETLKNHPTILHNTLLNTIDRINAILLEKENQKPEIVGLKIIQDERTIVEVSNQNSFSELAPLYDEQTNGFYLGLKENPNNPLATAYQGGVMTFISSLYVYTFQGEIQKNNIRFSGASVIDSHCCGQSSSFRIFSELYKLNPGDQVIVTTSEGGELKEYQFTIKAVAVVDPSTSMAMLSSNYNEIIAFFEEVSRKQRLSPEELQSLIESFWQGEILFLRTCDGNQLTTNIVNGQEVPDSDGRIVAVAEYGDQSEGSGPKGSDRPPFNLPIAIPTDHDNPCINGNNEACAQIMGGFFERLYERYPEIVAEELRKALELVKQLPQPTSTPVSAAPIPSPKPVQPTPSPTAIASTDAKKQEQRIVPSENKFQNLNNILNQERLTEIFPAFAFINDTDVVNLQALVMEIRNSQKESSFPERLSYFLSNPQHLKLLEAYSQALDELAESLSTAQRRHTQNTQNSNYEQVLRNFASELRLIQRIVEYKQLIFTDFFAGVGVGVVVFLLPFLIKNRSMGKPKNPAH